MGIPLTMVVEAVFGRALSALKDERAVAAKVLSGPKPALTGDKAKFVRTSKTRCTRPRSSPTRRATC